MIKMSRWLAARWLFLALLGAPATHAAAQSQACLDNVVVGCFDTCTNPLNFQECIIGCAAALQGSSQYCLDNCFNDPTCENKCQTYAVPVQACFGASQKVDIVRGTLALNRATGVWQQSVRLTNKTPLETLTNLVLVLDALTPGWVLANADGTTSYLAPVDRPYKDAVSTLDPGQSATLVLRFARTGTPTFNYIPIAYTTLTR